MAGFGTYERLPEDPPTDDALEAAFLTTQHLHEDDSFLGREAPVSWGPTDNLDLFFTRLYQYWEEKGFIVILTARILNLAALVFTVAASAVLLLGVDYSALHAKCLQDDSCSLWDVAIKPHPLQGGITLWKVLAFFYLAIFSSYCTFTIVHLVVEVRDLAEVRHFYATQLGLSERALRAATWPEVASRVVASQRNVRLCMSRDLSEHDIIARIMRRENYLIGMLNRGVLALHIPFPGLRGRVLLTKTLEWNLYWCILDPMFDEKFQIRPGFKQDPAALQKRFRNVAILNALLSPFLLLFLVIYFFMKNAEAVYHRPSTIGARRWSPMARWRLREFNELPCFLSHRLNAGHSAAERYVAQFPNYALSHVARFIAFVAGSFAAVLIALTIADERLLETDFADGRQTVWWLALLGVVLAVSRALIIEQSTTAFDPGLALLEVAAHTHHLPRHWRGRAHTLEVQEEFESLFRYRVFLFFEELASVVLTPVLLWFSLPRCADAVLSFVEENTVFVEGVGDVCSLAAFDLRRHGNTKYGSPFQAPKGARSRSGKMEKSLVSFAATYPTWHPSPESKQLLSRVEAASSQIFQSPSGAAAQDIPATTGSMFHNMHPSSGMGSGMHHHHPVFSLLGSQYPQLARLYMYQQYGAPWGGGGGQMRQGCLGHATQSQQRMAPLDEGASLFNSAADISNDVHESGLGSTLAMEGLAPEERIALSQAMLESFYEQQESVSHHNGENDSNATEPKESNGGLLHPDSQHSTPSVPPKTQPVAFPVPIEERSLQDGAAAPGSSGGTPRRMSASPGSAGRSPQLLSSELSVLTRQTREAQPSNGNV